MIRADSLTVFIDRRAADAIRIRWRSISRAGSPNWNTPKPMLATIFIDHECFGWFSVAHTVDLVNYEGGEEEVARSSVWNSSHSISIGMRSNKFVHQCELEFICQPIEFVAKKRCHLFVYQFVSSILLGMPAIKMRWLLYKAIPFVVTLVLVFLGFASCHSDVDFGLGNCDSDWNRQPCIRWNV